MAWCSSCGSQIPPQARFCSSCGAAFTGANMPASASDAPTIASSAPPASDAPTALSPDDTPTLTSLEPSASSGRRFATPTAPRTPRPSSRSNVSSSSAADLNYGKFLPGALLADRYRVVALLGRGGMGEVYRADDLTLGQAVAMKFLPEEAASNPALLERFRGEVRIARKVSHPNVCRVYDVGEVEGHTYLTMEYVDGEDLASLLRRIGRLPNDKAVDIARQLCAGLAAAHAKGVLHRDLKPANVMLDGRGQAVITDFGLAAFTNQTQGAEILSGTPAYMSPEQLAGKEVTEKSDIYALGLVLYELFTGKRAFSADNLAELTRSRAAGDMSRPSSHVKDLDPLVERVILRCLEPEPTNRPANALAVAAALPGGDPLAAALAAGETPSPQMVAAAGSSEGMNPRLAVLCLAACILGLIASVILITRTDALEQIPLDQSPEVLTHKAREVVAQLGYDPKPVDSAVDYDYNDDLAHWIEKNDQPHPDWSKVLRQQPPILTFFYRQSPRYMIPLDLGYRGTPGIISYIDPATTQSGMINLHLDVSGHLVDFQALPPQLDDSPIASKPVDWSPLFAAAGIDPSQLQPATPEWSSLANSDTRAAWTGQWPSSGRPLRVEAGAWRGKVVFFQLIGPWTRPDRMRPEDSTSSQKIGDAFRLTLLFLVIAGAIFLARRQSRQGKGDPQGALQLAKFTFVMQIALWLCFGHFVPAKEIYDQLALAAGMAFLTAALSWGLYMALEPYVRRLWPQTIISWSRLISGRVRDPLVGRDALYGVMLGLLWAVIYETRVTFAMAHLGIPPQMFPTDHLLGVRHTLGNVVARVPDAIQNTLIFFIVLVALRYLLKKPWAAGVAFVALAILLRSLGSRHPALEVVTAFFIEGIAAFALVRYGLITLAVASFVGNAVANAPVTFDFSRWYAPNAMSVPIVVLALAGWAFWTALAGQTLIKGDGLE